MRKEVCVCEEGGGGVRKEGGGLGKRGIGGEEGKGGERGRGGREKGRGGRGGGGREPEATQVVTPPLAATSAAVILLPMPPRPMPAYI